MTLSVQRGTDEPFDLTITRDVVQEREVVSEDLADGTVGYVRLTGFSDDGAVELQDALAAARQGRSDEADPRPARQPGRLRHRGPLGRQPVHRLGRDLLGAGRRRERRSRPTPSPDGVATSPDIRVVVPDRRRQRLGERDRRGRPPGLQACDPRRPDVVRQGHRPAVAGAQRRGRGVQTHDRALADAGQALDPRDRAHSRRGGRDPGRPARRRGPDARQGPRGARRDGRRGTCVPPPDPRASCTTSAHQVRFLGTKGGDVQ